MAASPPLVVAPLVVLRPPQRGLPRSDVPNLRGLSRTALRDWCATVNAGPGFRADQLFEWIHRHRVGDVSQMTNLPAALRTQVAQHARLDRLRVAQRQDAHDGTIKLRMQGAEGDGFETVLMPNPGRGWTICVSSMVGCSLTCRFCATATLGFVRNLATWEIVDQIYQAQDILDGIARARGPDWRERITNVVFMGMGEPLHNYRQVTGAIALLTDARGANIATRRITVSSSGLVPAIERFAAEGLAEEIGLALSLNATTDEIRDQIMPINRRWNIAALLDLVQRIPAPRRRRITFEYVLLGDLNDRDEDALRLVQLVGDLDCHVNAIAFNPHPGSHLHQPKPERVQRFMALCRQGGLQIHLRTPRGDDIAAACGQLALESLT